MPNMVANILFSYQKYQIELHRHILLNKYIPYLSSHVAWLTENLKHGGLGSKSA